MPLKLGTTNIGAIYKGTTPISAIYKGTTLVFSSFTWQEYLYEYLYHNLVPTTFPKNIFDGQLEIGTLSSGQPSSNSQFIRSANFISVKSGISYTITTDITPFNRFYFEQYDETQTFISETSSTNGVLTLGNTTKYIKFLIYSGGATYTNIPLNNTFVSITNENRNVQNKAKLVEIQGNSCVVNQLLKPTAISTTSGGITITNNNNGTFTLTSGTTTSLVYYAMYISTDKVQPIVGHKYLLFTNATGINGTSGFTIGAFGYYIENGKNSLLFTISNINNTDTCVIRIANGTSVNAQTLWANVIDLTKQFPFDTPTGLDDPRVKRIIEQGYISYNSGEIKDSVVGEISSNDTNDNLIGTITLPAPLDLGGVNTAHNTFEITKTNYMFTRNVWNYTFTGNETFGGGGSDGIFTFAQLNNVKATSTINDVGNNLFIDLTPASANGLYSGDMKIATTTSSQIWLLNKSYANDMTNFKSWVANKTLKYQLATPQVINIPRKHLGVIDLGTLTWTYNSTYNIFTSGLSSAKPVSVGTELGNIYCSKYITNGFLTIRDNASNNMQVGINTASTIGIRNTNYTSSTDFKNAMSGIYLFYETNAETTDFLDEMLIQSGGTITTDSEVLPNVKLNYKCK